MIKESDLKRWFKEKWVDISRKDKSGDHPPCGRGDADKGAYPKCRPSKKITKETPKTSKSLSKRDKKRAVSIKRRVERKSNNKPGGLARKPKYTKLSGDNMKSFISKRAKEEHHESNQEENSMIRSNLIQLADKALILYEVMEDNDINTPEWCQEKIAVASNMIDAIYDYLSSELGFDLQEVSSEVAPSRPEWEEEEEDEEE